MNESIENKDIALIDLLDVILDKGVAIRGDVIISVAGVDLVYLDLRVLISSVETLVQANGSPSITSGDLDEQEGELEYAVNEPFRFKNRNRPG